MAALEAMVAFGLGPDYDTTFEPLVNSILRPMADLQTKRSELVMQYPTDEVIAMIEQLDQVEEMTFASLDDMFKQPVPALGLHLFGYDHDAEYVDDDEEEQGWEEAENEVEDLLVVCEEE